MIDRHSISHLGEYETPTRSSQVPLKMNRLREKRIQKKRFMENNNTPNVIMSAMEKLENISQRAASKEDNFDHFGRYVASLLRTLPAESALMLQQESVTRILGAVMKYSSSSSSSVQPDGQYNAERDQHSFSSTSTSQDTWVSELSAAMDANSGTTQFS